MKCGIAIIWDGPEDTKERNDLYLESMVKMVSSELVDINKHFIKHGLKPLTFTVVDSNQVARPK